MIKVIGIPRTYLYFKLAELFRLLAALVLTRLDWKRIADKYETKLSEIIGSRNFIPTNSASSALNILLTALNLPPGSEIIMGPITVQSFIEIIAAHKLKIVFADINPKNYLIDPAEITKKITAKTKAILITPLFGWYGKQVEEIKLIANKHNILLIEDCAHTFGGSYKGISAGYFGDFGIYSFGPVKFPTGISSGALLFSDANWKPRFIEILESLDKPRRLRIILETLRYFTLKLLLSKYIFAVFTINCIKLLNLNISLYLKHILGKKQHIAQSSGSQLFLFDNISQVKEKAPPIFEQPNAPQMNMLLSQLNYYQSVYSIRVENARKLMLKLSKQNIYGLPALPEPGEYHSFWQFPLRVKNKNKFISYMLNRNIDLCGLLFLRSYNKDYNGENCRILEIADSVSDEIVYIPIFPNINMIELDYIVAAIIDYYNCK